MPKNNKTLYIIDGHAHIYSAYYAPMRALTSPDGEPTKVTYVFTTMLLGLIDRKKPDMLVVAMDCKGPSFRREMYSEYKAHRKPMPEDMPVQIDRIEKILEAMKIPILRVDTYEADDLIGTLAREAVGHHAAVGGTRHKDALGVSAVALDEGIDQCLEESHVINLIRAGVGIIGKATIIPLVVDPFRVRHEPPRLVGQVFEGEGVGGGFGVAQAAVQHDDKRRRRRGVVAGGDTQHVGACKAVVGQGQARRPGAACQHKCSQQYRYD